jgi:hypothetical protein
LNVKNFPAIVETTDRVAPLLDAAEYATVPLPVPLPPDTMVIHDAPLEADQVHPLWVVTAMLPVPPDVLKEALDGDIE